MDKKKYELVIGKVRNNKYSAGIQLSHTGLTSDKISILKEVIKILELETYEIRTTEDICGKVILQSKDIIEAEERMRRDKEHNHRQNYAIVDALNTLPTKFDIDIPDIKETVFIHRSKASFRPTQSSRVQHSIYIKYFIGDRELNLWPDDIMTADGKIKRQMFFKRNYFTPIEGKTIPRDLPDMIIKKYQEVRNICKDRINEAKNKTEV